MNQICRDIFRAIHEGKWLKIEYRNKADQITKYWIGIRDLDPAKRTLKVDGLHLGMYTLGEYDKIFVDSILSTEVIEGTYCPGNRQLIEDIEMHPERYKTIFSSSANLKILNYLELCNRMDTTPYITDYDLIHYIDGDRVKNGRYALNDQQFQEVVSNFQYSLSHEKKKSTNLRIKKLALNVLSIHTAKGLYVLAYRNPNLDVKNRVFQPDEDITVCTQFGIDGQTENARKFLDADEYELLEDFENNLEKIKITKPIDAMKNGIAYLPEDRKVDGIVGDLSVRDNIILAAQVLRGFFRPFSKAQANKFADEYIKLLEIKTASADTPIKSLSGGNQQKVILARWLLTHPEYLILDEPTRGIDIGTKIEIQKLVLKLASEGMSVTFISSETDEMLRTCSRLIVMRDRRKVGEISGEDLTQSKIMDTIAGGEKKNG